MLYQNHCLVMISNLMNHRLPLLISKKWEHMDVHGNLVVQCPIVRCLYKFYLTQVYLHLQPLHYSI
jgi:hypothetical protein